MRDDAVVVYDAARDVAGPAEEIEIAIGALRVRSIVLSPSEYALFEARRKSTPMVVEFDSTMLSSTEPLMTLTVEATPDRSGITSTVDWQCGEQRVRFNFMGRFESGHSWLAFASSLVVALRLQDRCRVLMQEMSPITQYELAQNMYATLIRKIWSVVTARILAARAKSAAPVTTPDDALAANTADMQWLRVYRVLGSVASFELPVVLVD